MNRSSLVSKGLMALVLAVCGMTAARRRQGDRPAQVAAPGPVCRLLRGAGQGLLQGRGLDVTIKPGGPDIAPAQVIAGNGADVVVDWMPSALASREAGVPLVNIAQVFNQSGLMLTCKKASGVTSPKDFKGKTLGVWYGGNEYPFLNWMAKLGNKPDTDIKILKQGFNVDPLLQNQAACISTMIYNEYWQVVDAGVKESDLVTFFYEKEGVATLEDGLYVMEAKLKDPAFVARMAKFLKASFKGWNDAVKDPEGAAKSWWPPTRRAARP
jgi:NitT/TauT family transport system substrate-binding protein